MASEPHHRKYVSDLRVKHSGGFTDVDLDVPVGKRRRHLPRNCQRAIVGARNAEHELTNGIVL